MAVEQFDAIVIGGGPGGSSASSYLARAGKKVLVLEKEIFPRFHIGESLLPYNRKIFNELGLDDLLNQEGFPKKYGAQFYIGNGSKQVKFVFSKGVFTREKEAIQVERAKFDHIMLKSARDKGADVREGWTVTRFAEDDSGVKVQATGPDGTSQEFSARFLIDASGRGNMTGNQEGTRVVHPHLKKLAVFGHFKNVRLDEGPERGDTIIVRLENKWFWIIPVSPEKTSVGCVMDQSEFTARNDRTEDPQQIFESIWKSSPVLRERMESAELVGNIQVTSDFSYYNKRYVGKRLLRVGDAAGFMDPIFSAGVFLAMYSGRMAAHVIIDLLANGERGRESRLAKYESRLRRSMHFYWEMVHNFYTTPFIEVFFEPRERFMMASAINAALAGELEGGWNLRWRMRLFFYIVKAQKRWGILPRISFAPKETTPQKAAQPVHA
ncbi:MAG TPA: NAD(P)/FAD-dependent oxidoreductase [Verrucomicrobiae bacterium]